MTQPLASLIATGTKLWLDSVDPQLVEQNLRWGATGATSNPIIVANLIQSGRFDRELKAAIEEGLDNEQIAWRLADQLVQGAQRSFLPIWEATQGNDGYVSFELDPLIEHPSRGLSQEQQVSRYIELGRRWAAGHKNRMIKVPATPAGLASLTELAAAGIPLNVTLLFTPRQYLAARDAVWRGAQQRPDLARFKSVYSIFVSRVDVYTAKHVTDLSHAARGMMGIVNAKQIWGANQAFWRDHPTPLQQEMIFASTGTKDRADLPWKYVAAFAGSDIETNPPETNAAVLESQQSFTRQIDQLPDRAILEELARRVDLEKMEEVLMREGVQKFCEPQLALLELIESKR